MLRISRRPALAACLSLGSLAVWAALAGPHAAAAVNARAGAVASQCQTVPAPSAGPTASASASSSSSSSSPAATASAAAPSNLCVSIQTAQDSIQAGQAGSFTIVVSADGPVSQVVVTLTGTGGQASFTGRCSSGDGGESCVVGDLDTAVAASSYQLLAQLAVPSGTAAGTSVALTASVDAVPALPATPAAAVAVSVTAPAAPSSSPAPSSSSTAPSGSATAPAAGRPATTSPATTTPATTPAVPLVTPQTIPAVGPVLNPGSAQSLVTTVANPGSIGSLLPVISPAADTVSPTSPTAGLPTSGVAGDPAGTAVAADRASATSSMFMIPTATAETLGVILLIIFLAMAARLQAVKKLFPRVQPTRPANGAHGKPAAAGRPVRTRRRRRDEAPKKDDSPPQTTPSQGTTS